MQAISDLSGYSVGTVVSVLVSVGYLKQQAELAAGLVALEMQKKAKRKTTKRGKRG
jgi:hypothetical protein